MENNDLILREIEKEAKNELKGKINETAVGYVKILNKKIEEKAKEKGIDFIYEEKEGKLIN